MRLKVNRRYLNNFVSSHSKIVPQYGKFHQHTKEFCYRIVFEGNPNADLTQHTL